MQFNFKKYIKENYIVERLQSDVLVHDILDDKGKMFTYYKIPYPGTIYYKDLLIYNELKKIIGTVFRNYDSSLQKNIIYNDEKIDTDEKLSALHDKYILLYNKYIDLTSKLFIKPDPQILSSLTYGITSYSGSFEKIRRDLFNITDDNFEKFTYSEIKKDKALKDLLTTDISSHLVFWFSADKEILCVSREGSIILYSINIENGQYVNNYNGRRFSGTLTSDIIEDAVKKENLIVNNIKCTLSDGSELNWPTISRDSFIGDKSSLCGLDFVHAYLDLTKYNSFFNNRAVNPVGSFMSKASKLTKASGWGNNTEDFLLIYKPTAVYQNGDKMSTYTTDDGRKHTMSTDNRYEGYNDMKASSSYDPIKAKRKKDFREILDNTYTWIKNILGKYEPYAGGKSNELFAYGKKLSEYDYEKLYIRDSYCISIASGNIKRYKNIIEQNKSLIGISEFNDKLKEILSLLREYILNGKVFCNLIKSVYKENIDEFKSLMLLYGVYSKLINKSLSIYGSLLHDIHSYKKNYAYNKDFIKNQNSNELERAKNSKRVIEYHIDDLLKLCDELKEIDEKIKTTLDN